MSDRPVIRIVWASAALCLAAGLVLAVQSARGIRGSTERLERKLRDIEKLKALEREEKRCVQAQQMYEKLANKHPDSLEGLLKEFPSAYKADDSKEARKDLTAGWVVRQKELSFGEVSMEKIVEFVRKAEAQRPPWVLTRCAINSAPGSGGTAQVILQLEAVERRE